MSRCQTCGVDNREVASFCHGCGASLKLTCPDCGAERMLSARFCDYCGRSLADTSSAVAPVADLRSNIPQHLAAKIIRGRAALEGERRTVTVLFADASGFTAMSERLDEELVYSIMQGCFSRMTDAVHRYEGTITQFLGDGVMALFGAPIAHEDSARRAVAAALEMQESLEQHAAEVHQRLQVECRFRVGLNTGAVVVGKIGDNLDMDYTALGDTVNLAARMQQMGEPGRVYLSESTYSQVRDYFECESLGLLGFKGISDPVSAYVAVGARSVRTRIEVAEEHGLTPLVGRSRELTVLGGHLEQVKRGQGQVVFVSGEAGIGKSRLLLEFRRSVMEEDLTWLEGHSISYGHNIPYLPIIDILKRNFGVEEGDDDGRIIQRVDKGTAGWEEPARATAPYHKYLMNVDPGDSTVAMMDSMERRAGIFDALRALISQESRRRPLVLVVEDLHWIDEQSEAVLEALVDVVATARVLIILTYRPGYSHSLGDRSYYSRLSLGHLPLEDQGSMVAGVLQVASLPQDIRQLITAKAEGNPFYIEEVTKSLLETGVLSKSNGTYTVDQAIEQIRVPDTIQEVILSRIDRLESEAREAIQLASVIGREFTARLLDRISRQETRMEDLLLELRSLELIYQKEYLPELSYMFKHALTHDVAYASMLIERRKSLHRVIGAAIEELYADRLAENYETLAHHYYQGEQWDRALDYLTKAAQKAADGYANQDALIYFDRALEVCGRLGDVAVETLMAIHGGKAEVNLTINDWQGGLDSYSRLRELARSAGNRTIEGLALGGVAFGHFWNHEFDLAEAEARETLSIADELDDNAVRTGGVFVLGFLGLARGELRPALNYADQALLLGIETEQPPWEVFGRCFQALNTSWRGLYEEAHPIAAEAVAAGERHHVTQPLLFSKWIQGLAFGGNGRYKDAIAALRDSIALCQRVGDKAVQSRSWNTIGWVYGELCDWDRAVEFNQRALELAIGVGDPEITINAQINLADAAFASRDIDRSKKELEDLYASLPDLHEWMKWRYSQHIMHSLGDVLLELGDSERALALADECLALAEPTESRKNIVKARRLRGQALLAQGRLEETERELGTALEVARETGNPPQLWKTHAAYGDLRRAQGKLDEARLAYREALSVIESMAAGLDDEALRETFLQSAHVRVIRENANC